MSTTTETNFNEQIMKSMEQFMQEEKPVNILIVGATGVGKSSLVNKVFNVDFAKTGTGKPVTQLTQKYEVPGMPIALFDTKGYELGSEEHTRFVKEMQTHIEDGIKQAEDQIHLVWYVISASGHRITDLDIEMLKKFKAGGKPVVVVFTKCDIVSEDTLQNLQTVLEKEAIENFYVSINLPSMNYLQLNELIEWSYNNLEEGVKWSFLRVQKVNLDLTKREINKAIRNHAAASFGVGFVPIPFADGPVLLANQAKMVGFILNKYGFDNLFNQLQTIVGALGAGQLVTQLGRYLVAQVIKFIPVVGTVTGGLINGTIAAAITVSLGLTVSEIGYYAAKAKLQDDNLDLEKFIKENFSVDVVQSMFEQFLKREIDDK